MIKKILSTLMIVLLFSLAACSETDVKYKVTFNADGGAPVPAVENVKKGEFATKPSVDPTKEGHTFEGWFLGNDKYEFDIEVLEDITLKAKWEKEQSNIEEKKDIKDMTSLEVVVEMGNGINLGNTMESSNRRVLGTDSDVSRYETHWGQPVTTREMIDAMHDHGFDTLRIPVAWTNMMKYEDEDYTINPAYLERVAEIVDYAIDNEMFVIVNDHWDGGWWGMFGQPSQEYRQMAHDLYVSMWTQVGEYFKDYPHYLVFESANEELGHRLNDEIKGVPGVLTTEQSYQKTNEINQLFVDIIRSTGGNNEDRFLLIAGFNTDINMTLDERFEMPTDTVSDKLLISVHYYDPSPYTIFESVPTWGTERDYVNQNEQLEKMTKFTDLGYGVIIGEYGVLPYGNGEYKNNTFEYFENFLRNMDLYGYVPMLWDTSGFFKRTELTIPFTELKELFFAQSIRNRGDLTREEIIEEAEAALVNNIERAIQREIDEGTRIDPELPYAWLMYTNTDWDLTYSLGDEYSPSSKAAGVVAHDVLVGGEGTYTVSLDFSGTSQGHGKKLMFLAIGLANGEKLYPGYVINIKSIKVNGEKINTTGIGYTTSDDGNTTRVNIYSEWVSISDMQKLIQEGKVRVLIPGQINAVKPIIVNKDDFENIQTIEVEFDYVDKS